MKKEKKKKIYKDWLVIWGFKDKNDYDLQDTYAPISRTLIIRAVLEIMNKYKLAVFK